MKLPNRNTSLNISGGLIDPVNENSINSNEYENKIVKPRVNGAILILGVMY